MNEFVEECRREWRRLGVPEPIANEMAADLTADLDEAQAEGGSPEDVLGNSAFDPRRFAASWAVAQGVTGPVPVEKAPRWRPSVRLVVAFLLGVATVVAGVILLVGVRGHAVSVSVRRAVGGPGQITVFPFFRGRSVSVGPFGPGFRGAQFSSGPAHPFLLLLILAGLAVLAVIAVVRWSPWTITRRDRGDRGPRSPSWN